MKKEMLTSKELSALCMQFCVILRAGIPIDGGISAIRESAEGKSLKAILKQLETELSKCETFSQALRNCGNFPAYMVNMVEIGERSGSLDNVMTSLSNYYENENNLHENIRTAVTYPIVLILMITAVMGVLVAKVLPEISKVLENLGGDLPQSSMMAISIGKGIGEFSFLFVIIVLLVAALTWIFWGTKRGKKVISRLAEAIPALRKTNMKIGSARFSSVLSMLSSSGYDTQEALELLPGILPTEKTSKKAEVCRASVANGEDFCDALKKTGFFSGLSFSMIKIGVKTGTFDAVMSKIAKSSSEEAQTSLSNLVSMIEPVMIGFLSAVIGCVLLSNLLPLLGIISSVG